MRPVLQIRLVKRPTSLISSDQLCQLSNFIRPVCHAMRLGLTARYVASLTAPAGSHFAGFFAASLSPSWVLLSDRFLTWRLPLTASLTPFFSFSPFSRIPPGSRPSCGSLILGLFTRLALEAS